MWHQLSMKLVQYMAPLNLIRPPDVSIVESLSPFVFILSLVPTSIINQKRQLVLNNIIKNLFLLLATN